MPVEHIARGLGLFDQVFDDFQSALRGGHVQTPPVIIIPLIHTSAAEDKLSEG